MIFWVLVYTLMMRNLCTSCSMSRAFERTNALTNSGVPILSNGHAHAFQSRYIDDAKVGLSKIQVVEFTETLASEGSLLVFLNTSSQARSLVTPGM